MSTETWASITQLMLEEKFEVVRDTLPDSIKLSVKHNEKKYSISFIEGLRLSFAVVECLDGDNIKVGCVRNFKELVTLMVDQGLVKSAYLENPFFQTTVEK
uniref:Uncharacterized protein n=1 Tax=Marseillevirus LCMAC101 TaxID=2506602 RepID=A0A481YT41_9VIRU|nr:MAG: hypothetical protein LCMAC101_02510 [Marseillevirus LCMAC101]